MKNYISLQVIYIFLGTKLRLNQKQSYNLNRTGAISVGISSGNVNEFFSPKM